MADIAYVPLFASSVQRRTRGVRHISAKVGGKPSLAVYKVPQREHIFQIAVVRGCRKKQAIFLVGVLLALHHKRHKLHSVGVLARLVAKMMRLVHYYYVEQRVGNVVLVPTRKRAPLDQQRALRTAPALAVKGILYALIGEIFHFQQRAFSHTEKYFKRFLPGVVHLFGHDYEHRFYHAPYGKLA